MGKKKFFNIEESKLQSSNDHNENSLNSRTGYKDTGNDTAPHAKARVIRNEDNGSHI